MASTAFPVVKGTRLRATKINACGMPVAGPGNRIVTKGFVSVGLTKVTKDAQDLTQENADGEICVQDRTPPVRRWYTPAIELCNVDPELITLLNGWQKVLDYEDNPIGFRDDPNVETDYGVALELWTGGRGDDDCPTPEDDSIFSTGGTGRKYGYFLFGGTEWDLGDITIRAEVATFTMTGRTIAMPHWGRGPYNVAGTDAAGTPGRLLVPVGQKEHLTVFRTPVAPPEPTNGAVSLQTSAIFTAPNYYYGGPANAPAADVAPEQAAGDQGYLLTITGGPTGGAFTLKAEYADSSTLETATIPYNSNAAAVKAALAALDDGFAAAEWTVTATAALPAGTVTIIPPQGVSVDEGTNTLTGGTTPTVVVNPA